MNTVVNIQKYNNEYRDYDDFEDFEWNSFEFTYERKIFYIQEFRKYMASCKIKQWWLKKILYNPRHPIGIKYYEKQLQKDCPDLKFIE